MTDSPLIWRWGESLTGVRELLAAGGVLAIPTESSYGLAADPRSAAGVAAIFTLKRRPGTQPLPVVAADRAQLEGLGVRFDIPALERLAACWPAPLTVIAPVSGSLPAAAGGKTLGIRIPAHRRLRTLLADLDMPLTATSANRSGEDPIVSVEPLTGLLRGARAAVVDGGDLPGGPPSTLVRPTRSGVQVLREGRYPLQRLRAALGELEIETSFSAGSVENPCG